MRRCLLVLAAIVSAGAASASSQQFTSPAAQAQLVELFTSQGCSSCPPAESWMNGLRDEPSLWSRIVPVAFHVDYWNRLGWTDPFSDASYTRRQRRYAGTWGRPSVYTPGFVVDGQEWRGWFERQPLPTGADSAGVLQLDWDGTEARVRFAPAHPAGRAGVMGVALLAMGRQTSVTHGENAGRDMTGDFVVIALEEAGLVRHDGVWHGVTRLGEPDETPGAIAAWVSTSPNGPVLQATGGWLKERAP